MYKEFKVKTSKILQELSKKVLVETVGKSLVWGMYEEEFPAEIKKWVSEQKK